VAACHPEAVRDALALARALYEADREAGADGARLAQIATAGRLLATAWQFSQCEPDTMGARAAPTRAREGVEALAALDWPPGVAELVRAVKRRVG
jgi:hypothetical protein